MTAAVLGISSATSNSCNIVVDVEDGANVTLSCNLSCISENFIQWNYYTDSNDAHPTVLHNGNNLNPSWLSSGITVDDNQTAAPSVLKIDKVMRNHSGIYECTSDHVGLQNDGEDCKMRFCLTTGIFRLV